MEVLAWTCPADSNISELVLGPGGMGQLVLYFYE